MADDRYISQVRLPDGNIYKVGGEPFTYNNTVAGDADDSQQPYALYEVRNNSFVIHCFNSSAGDPYLMTIGFDRDNLIRYNEMNRHWGMAFYIGESGKDFSPKKGTLMQQYCYEGYSGEFESNHDYGLSLTYLRHGTGGDCWLVKCFEKDPATLNPIIMWYLYDWRDLDVYGWNNETEFIHIGHYILDDAYIQGKGYKFCLNIDLSNHRFLRFTGNGTRKGIAHIDDMPIYYEGGDAGEPNMTKISYNSLVETRNACKLIPGTWYRITDYETIVYHNYVAVAGHPFDIIVRADSECKLNENAYAIQNKDDSSYFKNSNLGAWELKYCLNNDSNRFDWANPYGKGVIYWMKDEFGNEAPYDFKNILFERSQSEPITGLSSDVIDWTDVNDSSIINIQTLQNYIYNDRALCMPNTTYTYAPVEIKSKPDSASSYYYTFSYVEKPQPNEKIVMDYTRSGIASNNRIIPYKIEEVYGDNTARMKLPNNVCIAVQKSSKTPIFNNLTFSNCNGNTLFLEGQTSLYRSEFNDCNFNIFCCILGKEEEFNKLSNVERTVMIGLGTDNVFNHIDSALLMPGCGGIGSVNGSKFSYIRDGASICGPIVFCDIQQLGKFSMIYDTFNCVTDSGDKERCLIYLRSDVTPRYPRTIHGSFQSTIATIDFIDPCTNLPYVDWAMAYPGDGFTPVKYWKTS